MAKQPIAAVTIDAPQNEVDELASRLFVAVWRPENFKTDELARKCFDAAEAFEYERQERK